MPWVTDEQLVEARKVDLLTYLQEREPSELVRSAPGEYRTKSHGSLVISNGAWFWNRGQVGGLSALDYLIKVQGLGLVEAVETISDVRVPYSSPALSVKRTMAKHEAKTLTLPPKTKYPARVLAYLQRRGVHADIIRQCLDGGLLYEGRYQSEAVCVFVGRDDAGAARFACMRGITSDIKWDCAGSNKRFSFRLDATQKDCGTLAVFESPVDTLSHLCLYSSEDAHRLSLGGTSDMALLAFLEWNPQISNIFLCLDADEAGQTAARRITKTLGSDERFTHIKITTKLPPHGKDYNEALLYATKLEQAHKQAGHHKEAGFSI